MLKEVIIDYMSQFISDFFQPPDASQLTLSLWAGDAVLHNLVIKADAVESNFGLPINVTAGKVGKIRTKIPWGSLFQSGTPVEVIVEDLLVLLTPSYTVYDKETEDKFSLIVKKNIIQKLEEGYKEYIFKNSGEQMNRIQQHPQETYIQKLALQIVSTVHIKLESIHLRYEDKITNSSQPFSIGFIIKSIQIQTTDEKWTPTAFASDCVSSSSTRYQLGKLEGLALYWNTNSILIIDEPRTFANAEVESSTVKNDKFEFPNNAFTNATNRLKVMLTDESESQRLKYIIGPMEAEAKMAQNLDQEKHDFKYPHFSVDIVIQELALGISEPQVRDLLRSAETVEFIARNQRFKKYKNGDPSMSTTIHKDKRSKENVDYKKWWRFAYECVLEDVRRRNQNWSWAHMAQHRSNFISYIDLYYKQLSVKIPKQKHELDSQVSALENSLDTFNIILARKIVGMKRKRLESLESGQTLSWTSYILSWFINYNLTSNDIQKVMSAGWTSEEKAQLHEIIHLSEESSLVTNTNKNYPPDYESFTINFQINKISCVLTELIYQTNPTALKLRLPLEKSKSETESVIIRLEMLEFHTKLALRPVKNAMKFKLSLGSLEARGICDKPYIALSKKIANSSSNMLDLSVEHHPVDSIVDWKIYMVAQPVQLIYNWKTLQKLFTVFSFQPQIELSELSAAATSTLHKLKELSHSRIDFLKKSHNQMDVSVDFVAPYILVPHNGELKRNGNVLVIDLGKFHIRSQAKESAEPDSLSSFSIDSYAIELNNFQVFLVLQGESYGYLSLSKTNYLLKCNQVKVLVKHSMAPGGRLHPTPTLIVEADVPLVDSNISQRRCTHLINLVTTLPLPQSKITLKHQPSESVLLAESKALLNLPYLKLTIDEPEELQLTDLINDEGGMDDAAHHASVHSVWNFRVKSVKAKINPDSKNILAFELLDLVGTVKNRAYDEEISVNIGGMTLSILGHSTPGNSGPLYLINALYNTATGKPLLKFNMLTVAPQCPRKFLPPFPLTYVIIVSRIDLIFHQEALSTLINFIDDCVADSGPNPLEIQLTNDPSQLSSSSSHSLSGKYNSKIKVEAYMETLAIVLSTSSKNIAKICMEELHASFEQTNKGQTFKIQLNKILAHPMSPNCQYKQILIVEGDKVFDVTIISYANNPSQTPRSDQYDLSIKIITGSLFFFLLPSFISDIQGCISRFLKISESIKLLSEKTLRLPTQKSNSQVEAAVTYEPSAVTINLQAEAPKVAFPKNEFSPEAILIDFGELTLKNEIKSNGQRNQLTNFTFDEFNFIFQDATISRIHIDFPTQEILARVYLLNPFSCNCNIRRNLTSTDSLTPYLHIYVEFPENKIKVDTEDFGMLKQVFDEITKAISTSNESDDNVGNSGVLSQDRNETVTGGIGTQADTNTLLLSISFNLEHLDVILYMGITSLTLGQGTVQRDPLNCLAILSLEHFEGDCNIWNNSDILASLTVGDISIEDGRHEISESTKDILKRDPGVNFSSSTINITKSKHKLKTDPFFSINYQNGTIRNSNESNFQMKLPALSLNMNSEFLFEIFKFFSKISDSD